MSGVCGLQETGTSVYSIYHDLAHGHFEYHYLLISVVVALVVLLVVAVNLQLRLAGADLIGKSRTGRSDDAAVPPCPKLCDAVYQFHEPDGQPELEIVFIHGLQLGHFKKAYWTTWLAKDGSQDNCWPMTWLVDEFPKARILSISYDASALKTSTSGTMDLHPLGESLAQQMVLRGVGIGQKSCPAVFVCHSLGGLIAKQILVMAHKKFREDKKICKLLRNTRAFFFYATPHGGSKLFNMISWMVGCIPFLTTSPLVDNLKIMNLEIGRLNSEFEDMRRMVFSRRWQFYVVAETHATTFVLDEHKLSQGKTLELPSFVARVHDKLSMLLKKLKENPIVGLVGMGGIGKTTLSKIMYKSERENYERSCYLENVKLYKNIVDFQKQLLRELCDEILNENEDVKNHLQEIQNTIKTKKVLVVMDDVGIEENLKALQVLAFNDDMSRSKLVITCRDRAILSKYMTEREKIKVDGLNDEQALELFSHYAFHAFSNDHEIDSEERKEFENQVEHIVEACAGLPLSLEVVGQHLRNQNHHPPDVRMNLWKGALTKLKAARALGGHVNDDEKLWANLRVSYDDLEDWEQNAFLDFSCILSDMEDKYESTCQRIFNFGELQTLIDGSLIKVTNRNGSFKSTLLEGMEKMSFGLFGINDKKLVMHHQLRDMGRRIAMKSTNRTCIWKESDIEEFVEENEGLKTLEGLSLEVVKELWPCMQSSPFTSAIQSQDIQKYPKMRILNLSYTRRDVVEYFMKKCALTPLKLTWLCLKNTNITGSHLDTLGAFKELKVLHLSFCSKLLELPSSIGGLTSLLELNLGWCEDLKTLPHTIGTLGKLQILVLQDCANLEELPTSIGSLGELLELHLRKCRSLHSLPTTLGSLKLLKVLDLTQCRRLKEIPMGVG